MKFFVGDFFYLLVDLSLTLDFLPSFISFPKLGKFTLWNRGVFYSTTPILSFKPLPTLHSGVLRLFSSILERFFTSVIC